jgi:hypothetical protein
MATTVAGLGGLFADAFFGKIGFVVTLTVSLLLFLVAFLKERKLQQLYAEETIPVPVVVSVDDNTPIEIHFNSLLKRISEDDKRFAKLDRNLEYYFNISMQMLTFKYDGDMYDTPRLISFLQIIRYVLNDIQKRLDNKACFHLLFLRRPAFGVALGGMFRTDGIVVYQNNDYSNTIDKVAKIDSRKYKEKVPDFKHFKISRKLKDRDSKDLLLAVQISSHNVSIEHEDLKKFRNIILMHSVRNGTLPTDRDSYESDLWVEHAQEIYNIINQYKGEFARITLVHSMPEAVGVILGMALENYWYIDVYQFDRGHYRMVINLQEIKYYF